MNDIQVWFPLACAGAGIGIGLMIGFGAGKMRRRELYRRAVLAETCINAFVNSSREVLSDAWFKKVKRSYTKKVEEIFANEK